MWIVAAISLGLASNLHCLGMCGPLTLAIPFNGENRSKRALGILIYNLGRILTYSVIGLILGSFGMGLYLIGVQQQISIILGVLMIVTALLIFTNKKSDWFKNKFTSNMLGVQKGIGSLLRKNGYKNLFFIGVLNGLLPCGVLYVAVLAALAIGDITQSVIFMLFFGLGTLPVMFFVPLLKSDLKRLSNFKLSKLTPAFYFLFGVLIILRGANLGIPYVSPHFKKEMKVDLDSNANSKPAEQQFSCH